MALLDNGPDSVDFYVQTEVTDSYGQTVLIPATTPTTVKGRAQPATSDELQALGQVTSTIYTFQARSFPRGPYARLHFDGRDWDVVGDVLVYNGSPRTAHMKCLMRARDGVSV